MTIIQRKDGTIYNLRELGIRTKEFDVNSIPPVHETEIVSGRPGQIDMGTRYDSRIITCLFFSASRDLDDYPLKRNEIFQMLRSDESFYLIDSRESTKRWEVKVNNSFGLTRKFTFGEFSVDFICNKGFSESVGVTPNPFEFSEGVWGVGQGLIAEDWKYSFSNQSFQVFNAGTEAIDPRYLDLKIKFVGASSNLLIRNLTTGEEWNYKGNSNVSDVILLDGIRSTKNNLSIFRDTNKKILTLAPGRNNFSVTGNTGAFVIDFEFRFYYV
ncbi:phage-related protein [Cytobacillus horneckiae]|uniref:phage tail family protein n=1 Tax=Cytobacillus horneckiae TaxID=549687 RepID=UPI0019D273B1|nr:phage tail family protein [Cytobacillus horneckiae]MBN6889896.1 phage tail family protein [Cytobacillus horneckiae]